MTKVEKWGHILVVLLLSSVKFHTCAILFHLQIQHSKLMNNWTNAFPKVQNINFFWEDIIAGTIYYVPDPGQFKLDMCL